MKLHRCCDKIINFNFNTFKDYSIMKKAITYSVAAIALVGVAVLLFSTIGVAVFFLPLLAGAFK
uniref:Type IV pilin n=3 Tax=unclassified Caudoviricetes TaxID=2788787 RepID=A0A8S5VBF0_9CAUD|nr:MAG TPA: type IV pilin [Siphoviridae sp. ctfrT39]DAG03927.1 MAG TPA: type IV pilin [Siphoviridae sp. ct0vA12]